MMDYNYLAAVLFFLPAGLSNLAPVLANKIPLWNRWNTAIDFGVSYKGKRITGDNKRWRGVISGALLGGVSAVLIAKVVPETIINDHVFWTGFLLGLGALAGDCVESIIKRRLGIKPGDSWFPWDQIDYIIGGLVLVLPVADLPFWAILTIMIVYFPLHLLVAYIGYLLGLKSTPI